MSHPQNSPRGVLSKQRIETGSMALTTNSSGVVFSSGVKISNAAGGQLRASATALLLPTRTALPTTREIGGVCFVSSAGKSMLAYHSTGTTWVYANKTSVLA